MSLYTLFDTTYSKARNLDRLVVNALPFLITNGSNILLQPDQVAELATTKLFASTPIGLLYQSIAGDRKFDNFAFLNFCSFPESVPEVLSYDEMTIDGKTIPNIPVPAQLQKCWINLTPILSAKDSYHGHINITDASALASLVVRAALCQTYDDQNGMWLNPKLAEMAVEIYANVCGYICRQMYNLGFDEEKFAQTMFAAYMAQVMGPSDGDLRFPPLLLRCTFLGSARDITERMEHVRPYRPMDGDSIFFPALICEALAKAGPPRMHNFNFTQFLRAFSASSLDSQTMLNAVEYPPYWVYQILRCAGGYKNPLISNVMRINNRIKIIMTQFATELHTKGVLLAGLNRS